jgi:transcription antitermination protein NusB
MAATGRHGSRRLLVQALYQSQLAGHSAAELVAQFSVEKDFEKMDVEFFRRLLGETLADTAGLDALIAGDADRPVAQLDPVEHGILWLGLTELKAHPEIPVKVVIAEAVQLAKEFGATDGYRYINALLDRLAPKLRPAA